MTYFNMIKNMWHDLYDPDTNVQEVVDQYFHQDYAQCINGVTLNRGEYVEHVENQKQNIRVTAIEYKQILEQENEVFLIYYPKAINLNQQPVDAEVIAYFSFQNEKIRRIHGLVRLINGELSDVDMSHHK